MQLKKRVYYVRIERIDGGEKMNNSQNKNLLTEGSIWKKLMGFAFPLFLGNLFQQLYNTADSLIVDYIVGFRQDDMSRPKPSSIIKLDKGGVIKIIRE